ncbi:MAG: hypothetical protein CSB49_03715 [Proteobacteria bacterium]|nr:MAG: hypothetical protein CSB49_03715 [Pseudomonadota bacterium]
MRRGVSAVAVAATTASAAILAVIGLTGCPPASVGPVDLAKPTRSFRARDYERELDRWTRYGSYLRQLDTTLRLYATWRGPRYDAAYIAKRQKMFGLPQRDVDALRRERETSRAKALTFVLVAATHDISWNDFDRRPSHWRLSLRNDRGEQVAPISVKQHRRTTATDIAFFPHLRKLFHTRYTVRFPRAILGGKPLIDSSTTSLTLRASGALGKVELTWKLRR